jgi:hypothetical protein
MKATLLSLCALLSISRLLTADELPIMVADSGSKEVDALVAQLVSRRPHPFPPSGEVPENIANEHQLDVFFSVYKTTEVSEAIEKLKKLGPAASMYLLAHIDDDRYSYSAAMPTLNGRNDGWYKMTVGMVVRDIITGGFWSSWLYKWRDGPNDGGFFPPQFSDYLKTQGGLEKWVAANSKNSKSEVFSKYINWCITTERERGFRTKDDETRILARYEKWKKEVEQDAP